MKKLKPFRFLKEAVSAAPCWIYCGDKHNLPPNGRTVHVLARTAYGVVQLDACSCVFNRSSDDLDDCKITVEQYLDAIQWYSRAGMPISSVVAWLYVPSPTEVIMSKLLAGEDYSFHQQPAIQTLPTKL